QIGLSQSAYPHIEVDGMAGKQTREAIAQFEKHYRLPVTGLPNQQVLDKLKSIGAF
ncbi:MAG: peptidoglycan-binding domain-containing protein, partial [Lentilitoribacter sp.]